MSDSANWGQGVSLSYLRTPAESYDTPFLDLAFCFLFDFLYHFGNNCHGFGWGSGSLNESA